MHASGTRQRCSISLAVDSPLVRAASQGGSILVGSSPLTFGVVGVGSSIDMYSRGTWADLNGTPTLVGHKDVTPGVSVDVLGCDFINVTNWTNPYSFHTGGVNALRCDGSVAFLRQSVSPAALFAFWTRNGGEVLSIDN